MRLTSKMRSRQSPPSSAGTSSGSSRTGRQRGGPSMAVEGPPIRASSRRPSARWSCPPGREDNRAAILAPDQSARYATGSWAKSAPSRPQAADWARKVLAAKNSLTAVDAGLVEAAFERDSPYWPQRPMQATSQAAIEPATAQPAAQTMPISAARSRSRVDAIGRSSTTADHPEAIPPSRVSGTPATAVQHRSARGIDKSVLTIAEPRRYRSKEHLRFVATRACLICGRKPSDPHHLRFTQPRALGRKVSDEFAVPLCRVHHRALHRSGNERVWWQTAGIDPIKVARKLWKKTRLNDRRAPQCTTPTAQRPQPPSVAPSVAPTSTSAVGTGADQEGARRIGDGRSP